MSEPHLATLMATKDPEHFIMGQPIPALTTLLHGVCGNDPEKFEEATRLIELFIEEALRRREAKPG